MLLTMFYIDIDIDAVANREVEALSSSVAIDADTDAPEYWAFLYVPKLKSPY